MSKRVLAAYSIALTCAVLVHLATAWPKSVTSASFDQITVHRINVIEPDGTLRMVVSDHAQFPGLILYGQEKPYARPQAGMLFYNDEGSETGGLIFAGHKNADGKVIDSGGSLSFDRYGLPNQIVQLAGVDDTENHFSGLTVNDSPQTGKSHQRIWVGRDATGAASIELKDGLGRKRIVMQVPADGEPSLLFFDQNGRVLNQMTPLKGK